MSSQHLVECASNSNNTNNDDTSHLNDTIQSSDKLDTSESDSNSKNNTSGTNNGNTNFKQDPFQVCVHFNFAYIIKFEKKKMKNKNLKKIKILK